MRLGPGRVGHDFLAKEEGGSVEGCEDGVVSMGISMNQGVAMRLVRIPDERLLRRCRVQGTDRGPCLLYLGSFLPFTGFDDGHFEYREM